MSWLWFLIIGLVAGWLGSLIVKGSGSGLIINLIVGIIGSYLGGFLLGNLFGDGLIGHLIVALIGAIILLWIVSLFMKKKK